MPGLLDVKEKSASLLPGASRFLAKSNNGILAYYNYTSQSGREHTTLMISAERKQLQSTFAQYPRLLVCGTPRSMVSPCDVAHCKQSLLLQHFHH